MDLNNDLVHEILLRLPVQSLVRFRSVCKSWCSIIDSSYFRNSHLENQLKKNEDDETLFLQYSNWEMSILKADSGKLQKGFPVFQKFLNDYIGSWAEARLLVDGPVNGLICMYTKIPYIRRKRSWNLPIAIYNPCLDKINILPVSPWCLLLDRKHRYTMRSCIRSIGFGFDSVTKDYKIVQLIVFPFSGTTYVELYSGTTNTWRELVLDNTMRCTCRIHGIQSKSVSSAHWRIEGMTGGMTVQYILSFDMQTEVFDKIMYSNLDVRSEVFAKDDDSFAHFVRTCNLQVLQVWELERRDKEGGWTHVRDVNVEPFLRGLNPIWPRPIALWKRDGVVLMESDDNQRNLIFYDYSTENVTMCCEIPNGDTKMLQYKGSLISP